VPSRQPGRNDECIDESQDSGDGTRSWGKGSRDHVLPEPPMCAVMVSYYASRRRRSSDGNPKPVKELNRQQVAISKKQYACESPRLRPSRVGNEKTLRNNIGKRLTESGSSRTNYSHVRKDSKTDRRRPRSGREGQTKRTLRRKEKREIRAAGGGQLQNVKSGGPSRGLESGGKDQKNIRKYLWLSCRTSGS